MLVFIVLWCLLPFYWMVVEAFRSNAYTYDNTFWFTHVTWSNFRTRSTRRTTTSAARW